MSGTGGLRLSHRAWNQFIFPLLSAPSVSTATPPSSSSSSSSLSSAAAASQALYDRYIVARYGEPQRHYHTLDHVDAMLGDLVTYLTSSSSSSSGEGEGEGPTRAGESEEDGPAGESLDASPLLLLAEAHVDAADALLCPSTDALRAVLAEIEAAEKNEGLPQGQEEGGGGASSAAAVAAPAPAPTAGRLLVLSVVLGVLFHDAVYDPTAKDNEARSDDWLREFLAEAAATAGGGSGPVPLVASLRHPHCWIAAVAAEASAMIIASSHHFTVPPACRMRLGRPGTNGTEGEGGCGGRGPLPMPTVQLFLDLDLAILGSPADRYDRYAQQIREEYIHFCDTDFCRGRGQFLASAVEPAAPPAPTPDDDRHQSGSGGKADDEGRGGNSSGAAAAAERMQLYKTPFFFRRLEARAWGNMERELTTVRGRLAALESQSS